MAKGLYNIYKITETKPENPKETTTHYQAGVSPLGIFYGTNTDFHKRIVSIERIEQNVGLRHIINHKLGIAYLPAERKIVCVEVYE